MTGLVYVDGETTGLDSTRHQCYEFAWWPEHADEPLVTSVPHSLAGAEMPALKIGKYFERGFHPWQAQRPAAGSWRLTQDLVDATLVGSNVDFDAGFLLRQIVGVQVWSHRTINISNVAMAIFNWDTPRGLDAVARYLIDLDYEIPLPDHTAEGDVRTTRAAYEALRTERAKWTRA